MATTIRMRCPGCGILVDQERLDGEHEFEIIVHEVGSRGRGKIYNIYRKPDKIDGYAVLAFKMGIAAKFRQIADRLESSVSEEIVDAEYVDADGVDVDDDGSDEEWGLEGEPETVLVSEVLLGDLVEAESVKVQEPVTVLRAEAQLKVTGI